MNSKQLNFFTVPEDLPLIFSFFNEQGVKYVSKNMDDTRNIQLKKFPYSEGGIYEHIYLTSDEFKSDIYLPSTEDEKLFPIDLFKSYVLQFSPGRFNPACPTILYRGRFYCTTGYFVSNGESVAKGEHFKKWVDKIFRVFKKEFLKAYDERVRIFFSPKTITWMEANDGIIDKAFFTITI
jgi:hypothetical protein